MGATDDSNTGTAEFIRMAEDLQAKLGPIPTAESMAMAHEVRELAETFKSWRTKRPDDDPRIAAINRFMELNRRVMQYLAQRPKPPRKP
jgi:hypothetical protein